MSSQRAMKLYEKALAFRVAGDIVEQELAKSTQLARCPIGDPIYFLYHQAVELALKACLLTINLRPGNTHGISHLFDRCWTANQLSGLGGRYQEIQSFIRYLDGPERYRYGQNTLAPQLVWARDCVQALMEEVELRMKAWGKANSVAGPWDPYTVTGLTFRVRSGISQVKPR